MKKFNTNRKWSAPDVINNIKYKKIKVIIIKISIIKIILIKKIITIILIPGIIKKQKSRL